MKALTFISLALTALFFGTVAAITQHAVNPALSYICLAIALFIIAILVWDIVEQMVNKPRDIKTILNAHGMSEYEVHLIYITEHPNKFSEETVRHAHLQLDEYYYNRIHNKDGANDITS